MTYICGANFAAACDMRWAPRDPPPPFDLVYVKTDNALDFFDMAAGQPGRSFTVLTHNSDYPASPARLSLMPASVRRWWAVNVIVADERVTAIPLGVANPCWPHGQFVEITLRQDRPAPDQNRVLVRHWTKTNIRDRLACSCQFIGKPWATVAVFDRADQRVPFGDWIREIADHRFVACPVGNGPDTHRLWETLYMRRIPIVLATCRALRPFVNLGLPIAAAAEWSEVTHEWLSHQWQKLNTPQRWARAAEVLTIEYWMGRIRAGSMEASRA